MRRRDLLKSAAALSALPATDGLVAASAQEVAAGQTGTTSPNILYIIVDELRFPKFFPAGISDIGQFLQTFMPNLYDLWQCGIKFENHFTDATACTPARGCLISGLYSQQSWLLTTILARPDSTHSSSPVLNRAYPTYGSLLRENGYLTPYIGKWHASIPPRSPASLAAYGFQGLTYPDPTGANLQGTVGDRKNGYLSDADVTDQAIGWLRTATPGGAPWCLTVSLVNPHDHEFFWAGTEFETYNGLFDSQSNLAPFTFYSYNEGKTYPPVVPYARNPLRYPPGLPYLPVPPNWESGETLKANKPRSQTFGRTLSEAVWGGVSDQPTSSDFHVAAYPGANPAGLGIGIAPFSYWQRTQQSYTQTMTIVDQQIGRLVKAIPPAIARNTVIVFTADHGDYAGSHGFVSGKISTLYDEAFNVPLIVVDQTGQFAADIATPRTGLTASVDNLRLLVTLGYGGSTQWLTSSADLQQLYGKRADLFAMLKSSDPSLGRPYVVLTTDELAPGFLNFNHAPLHIVGVRTPDYKFGVYSEWKPGPAAEIDVATAEFEYYDYSKPEGRLELLNETGRKAVIRQQLDNLIDNVIPNELRAPLPSSLQTPQALSRQGYLLLEKVMKHLQPKQSLDYIGYGVDF